MITTLEAGQRTLKPVIADDGGRAHSFPASRAAPRADGRTLSVEFGEGIVAEGSMLSRLKSLGLNNVATVRTKAPGPVPGTETDAPVFGLAAQVLR